MPKKSKTGPTPALKPGVPSVRSRVAGTAAQSARVVVLAARHGANALLALGEPVGAPVAGQEWFDRAVGEGVTVLALSVAEASSQWLVTYRNRAGRVLTVTLASWFRSTADAAGKPGPRFTRS